LRRFTLWYNDQSGGVPVKDFARRYFYSLFNAFTLAESVAIRAYPQDVVDYSGDYYML
jgi:hypothetical protein